MIFTLIQKIGNVCQGCILRVPQEIITTRFPNAYKGDFKNKYYFCYGCIIPVLRILINYRPFNITESL